MFKTCKVCKKKDNTVKPYRVYIENENYMKCTPCYCDECIEGVKERNSQYTFKIFIKNKPGDIDIVPKIEKFGEKHGNELHAIPDLNIENNEFIDFLKENADKNNNILKLSQWSWLNNRFCAKCPVFDSCYKKCNAYYFLAGLMVNKYTLFYQGIKTIQTNKAMDIINKISEIEPCSRCGGTGKLKRYEFGKMIEYPCYNCKKPLND